MKNHHKPGIEPGGYFRIFQEFGYSGAADAGTIAQGLADLAWFPVPIRARCTLTTEGAMYPMVGPPTSRGW